MENRKKTIVSTMLLIALTTTLYYSCTKDNYVETVGVCPEVISTSPNDLATLVPLDKTIEITFNEKMNASSFTNYSFVLEAVIGGVVTELQGVLSYDDVNNKLSFNPTDLLLNNTTYTGRVKPIVKDLNGNLLQYEYIWSFSTSATISPVVVYTDPSNLDSNVSYNQVITATFNMPMDASTITDSSFKVFNGLTPITGQVSYSGLIAGFIPNNILDPYTTYTCKVTTLAKNLDGTALLIDYIWTFKTAPIIIPTVLFVDPNPGETGVVINKNIKANFSQNMDPSTFTNTSFTLKDGANVVSGVMSIVNSKFTFNPDNNLSAGTIYDAEFTTDIKSTAGTALASKYTWQFTTGVNLAPEVISTIPLDGANNVPFNQPISANFDQAMDPLTLTNATFTVNDGNANLSGVVSYIGNTVTFTSLNPLVANTTYTATITNGAKSLGNVSLVNNYEWTFSTASVGVDLNSVARFGIIAGVGVSNDAGFSVINNLDVGIYPGVRSSITGFPPATIVNGKIYAADDPFPAGIAAMLIQAKQDLVDAYLFAEAATLPAPQSVAGDQGGKTLAPGIYKSTSTLLVQSGNLTLDAQGDPNAVWIFQIASDFTTVGGAGGSIILSGGAHAKNVFWQTGRSATIGDGTIFKGNILALTSITMNTGAVAEGRMLAQNGSVVMTSTNTITKP